MYMFYSKWMVFFIISKLRKRSTQIIRIISQSVFISHWSFLAEKINIFFLLAHWGSRYLQTLEIFHEKPQTSSWEPPKKNPTKNPQDAFCFSSLNSFCTVNLKNSSRVSSFAGFAWANGVRNIVASHPVMSNTTWCCDHKKGAKMLGVERWSFLSYHLSMSHHSGCGMKLL